jgi:hypothetical protein
MEEIKQAVGMDVRQTRYIGYRQISISQDTTQSLTIGLPALNGGLVDHGRDYSCGRRTGASGRLMTSIDDHLLGLAGRARDMQLSKNAIAKLSGVHRNTLQFFGHPSWNPSAHIIRQIEKALSYQAKSEPLPHSALPHCERPLQRTNILASVKTNEDDDSDIITA